MLGCSRRCIWLFQSLIDAVNSSMHPLAVFSEGIVRHEPFSMHQVGAPRTVRELVKCVDGQAVW
jgi:hypothetical protein